MNGGTGLSSKICSWMPPISLNSSTQMLLVSGLLTVLWLTLADNVLNVNCMKVKPGGKPTLLWGTIVLPSNLPSKPGQIDTHGLLQSLVYPLDHPNRDLQEKAKGMQAILEECVSVYDQLVKEVGVKKMLVEKYESYWKSHIKKDVEQ